MGEDLSAIRESAFRNWNDKLSLKGMLLPVFRWCGLRGQSARTSGWVAGTSVGRALVHSRDGGWLFLCFAECGSPPSKNVALRVLESHAVWGFLVLMVEGRCLLKEGMFY